MIELLESDSARPRQVRFSDSQVPVKCPEYPVLKGFCGREEGLSRLNPAEPVDVWRVMSPTSYQAAPPRERMIADAGWFVKPRRASRILTGETIKINFVNCVPALPRLCLNEIFPIDCEGLMDRCRLNNKRSGNPCDY